MACSWTLEGAFQPSSAAASASWSHRPSAVKDFKVSSRWVVTIHVPCVLCLLRLPVPGRTHSLWLCPQPVTLPSRACTSLGQTARSQVMGLQ